MKHFVGVGGKTVPMKGVLSLKVSLLNKTEIVDLYVMKGGQNNICGMDMLQKFGIDLELSTGTIKVSQEKVPVTVEKNNECKGCYVICSNNIEIPANSVKVVKSK